MSKYKHLTSSERNYIEKLLNESYSFKAIARELDKHCTTISKEIRNHIKFKQAGAYGVAFNNCKFRFDCSVKSLCVDNKCRNKYCHFCPKCNRNCSDYSAMECPLLLKPPYVCNGCSTRSKCSLEKRLYSASFAQYEYMDVRFESRSGISISEDEASLLDSIVSPLIKKGQSIHHICFNNKDSIMFSEKCIYNYVDYGIFSARNIDLPRKVRYRPRKSRLDSFKVDRSCRIGRNYEDFQEYIKLHLDTPIVQLDSVEGVKGGKVLLTIHFIECQFMLAFLRDANDSKSVINIFEDIYSTLGRDVFMNLFKLCLADNGSEFSNPSAIEFDVDKARRSRLFYCDPSAPYQKGAAENNHEFIRRILPKGTSFNNLTQERVNVMMNHINSYARKKLGNLTPYEMFKMFHGSEILERLGVQTIHPNDIILQPSLLK